jgi:hypothetical protein
VCTVMWVFTFFGLLVIWRFELRVIEVDSLVLLGCWRLRVSRFVLCLWFWLLKLAASSIFNRW